MIRCLVVLLLLWPGQDDDGTKAFTAALDKTIEGGGVKIQGIAKNNSADDPIFAQLGATSLAFLTGKFEVVADPGGFRVLSVERAGGRADVFQSGKKRIVKEIWEKQRMNLDGLADDVLSLADLKTLRKHMDKAKFGKPVQLTGEQKGVRLEGTLPADVITNAESEDVMKVMTQFGTMAVKVKAVIDEAGRLRTMEVSLEKENDYMDLIRQQLGMEPKKGADVVMKYALEITVEEGLKPDVPKDVLRYFEE